MTAPNKRLGHKVVVSCDGTAIACLRGITLPEKARDEVDVTCLNETIEAFLDADPPKAGMLILDLVWEPGAVNSEYLDGIFALSDELGNASEARSRPWTVDYLMFDNGTSYKRDTFNGRILKLTPVKLESKTLCSRTVEIRQTSAIVRSTVTP